ncbi:huntingtin-interacting protein 1-related protein isoform X2 [Plutella xylostella]|uniref:huntingtin-interacting protein 1-related protein isoform X1 n=2 Tax=Plutella xylostella TaxID=51655 RepID=UPI002032F4C9|nr:huntingtin-interacting protein 1-related protein isoform X1 [Plutella xylostella]XP_048478743.1 huntingtin-interacting protein 1-related protein isoform X2 [Plutella xylostella]
MASLSLPRVLQLKKNSLDAEREQFEKFQTLAIQKAINSVETPVKEKHVRSTIIGTFQEQSAVTYWMVAIRLPLQDNRIVAWKFCHVTHKVLREGHPACLDDSRRHTGMIENLGKLWVHLREGYGRLVHLYCQLLVTKIQFHARNPRFPPSLSLTAEELDAIAENDVNNYFQLCVELFDYMDDILNLQAAVFDSLGNARANSMTASGQCRLAALIPCAQDSSQIYDCNVRILFRLHASLPADTLSGHRERFGQQFKKLSSFYKHASSLQYYRNLLSLPVLPSNPPNFLLQSDFGTYVAPVVSIPEPSPEEQDAIGSLIDTSDTMSQMSSPDQVDTFERPPPSPQPDPVLERDRLIDHLQGELRRMRSEVQQLMQERNAAAAAMRDHCSRLEGQLHATKTELQQEKQKADLISAQTPEIKQKLTETEEKAKLTDEKFQKLKGAYTQLREEHISLIRQKAEVDKLSASLRAAAAEHESAKMALQQQLNDKVKDVELLQQSASSSEEVQAYKNELTSLRAELELSRQKDVQLETLRASMETLEIEHKTAATEAQEKINNITSELKDVKENFENIKKEKEDRETELSRVKEELVGLREKSGEEYTKAVEEKEAALKQIEVLKEQFQQEKQLLETRLGHVEAEKLSAECELQDLLQGSTALEERVGELTRQLVDAQAEVVRQRLAIVSSAGSAAHQMATTALSSLDGGSTRDASRAAAALAATAFEDLARHKEVTESPGSVARAAVLAAHSTAQLATYVTDVANVATDMAVSDKLTSECRSLLNATVQCMESLSSGASSDQSGDLSGLVREMLVAAVSADRSVDGSRSVDDELADMDTAIEDAARQIEEMLAASRKGDSGVKLEVNSKILDACTTLMAAVKVLVQDARQLQGELGDAPARRVLYRRNPQWSDGLISAAKAVVFAAKLLVSSADEAVSPSGSGRSEGVSAAAHEVAGSTAQLVAASRVRSAPASPALARLTQASRHVAAATGAVVAAVRAGSALITDQEALDTSKLTLTAARRLEMESKVRTLELEVALEAERRRLAALRKRHYQLDTENGGITNGNGKE